MSYIVLRGRWSNIIIPNVHVPCEEESDDSIDSYYGELKQVQFGMKVNIRLVMIMVSEK